MTQFHPQQLNTSNTPDNAHQRAKMASARVILRMSEAQVCQIFGHGQGRARNPIWALEHLALIYSSDYRAEVLHDAAELYIDGYSSPSLRKVDQAFAWAEQHSRTLAQTIASPLIQPCWQTPDQEFLFNQLLLPAGDTGDSRFELCLEEAPLPAPFEDPIPLTAAEVCQYDPVARPRHGHDAFSAALYLCTYALAKAGSYNSPPRTNALCG